jgi:hypothetical protein
MAAMGKMWSIVESNVGTGFRGRKGARAKGGVGTQESTKSRSGIGREEMAFAIKTAIGDPQAETFVFAAQKTMYGGKHIGPGDPIFLFASESGGGQGLVARGIVTSTEAVARKPGIARQTPRVTVAVRRTALAKRPLGRSELRHLTHWDDGQPGTELNFKFYRQATDKIAAISDETATFLGDFF